MSARTFPIGVILSASTGVFVCDRFADVHELIEHLAGGPVWTHQLGDAVESLLPGLVAQLPWLAGVPAPSLSGEEECRAWVVEQSERYGAEHAVTPVRYGWSRNPITDLAAVVGPDRVTPIVVDGPS